MAAVVKGGETPQWRVPSAEGQWLNRGSGIRTLPLVTSAIGGRAFLSGITEIPSGKEIPLHLHNCEESVVVLEGVATMETNDGKQDLVPFDATWIAPGVEHRFVNRHTSLLRILWVYGSIEATRTLVSTGVAVPIGDPADTYDG